MGLEPNDRGIQVREDLWEHTQCPACHMFIGVYVVTPTDPNIEPKLTLIPPDKIAEVAAELKERWRTQGTMVREGSPSITPGSSDA